MLGTNGKNNIDVKTMALIAMMAAVMCIAGPLSVPLPMTAVPISLTNLIVFFAVYMLGMKAGTISYLLYYLLGVVGLPVFSGFTGGFGAAAGPTGGYLIGFIALALICGIFVDKTGGNRWFYLLGMILGSAALYAIGTAWLAYQSGLDFGAALFAGVIPFLPGDAIKIAVVTLAAKPTRHLIFKATPGYGRGRK